MLETLWRWWRTRRWEQKPEDGRTTPAEPRGTSWTVTIRPPMGDRGGVTGEAYEWGLTRIFGNTRRECAVSGIWFLATAATTLAARATIERFANGQRLRGHELQALIETYRAPESRVRMNRRIGAVQREDTFESAYSEGFVDALAWDGIDDAERRAGSGPPATAPTAGGEAKER